MLEILLTDDVNRTLASIHDYTTQTWGISQADKYLRGLLTSMEQLAITPAIGRSHEKIDAEYRLYSCGRHIVVYRYDKKQLMIVAILHESMDIATRIEDLIDPYH
jgi:toxin ParE1/3/4